MSGLTFTLPVFSVRVSRFCEITDYTDKAVRRKIQEGVWMEGYEYHRTPTGEIAMYLPGYERWVRGFPRVRADLAGD